MRPKISHVVRRDTYADENTTVFVKPLYARAKKLSELLGISYSTVLNILDEYEKDHKTDIEIFVYVTSTLRIIHIDSFIQYLKQRETKIL